MTSVSRKSVGDSTPSPAVPFSYAQAAKGMSTSATAHSSRLPSGPAATTKDTGAPSSTSESPIGTMSGQHVDVETTVVKENDALPPLGTTIDSQSNTVSKQSRDMASDTLNVLANPPSPEFGTSSTSTLAREDDTSSLPNTSSESTWEVKSQSSNVPEKTAELPEEKDKGKKKPSANEKPIHKPLQEAPIPPVNIWTQRAEEAKAKATLQAPTTKETSSAIPQARSKPSNESTFSTKAEVPSRNQDDSARHAGNGNHNLADNKASEKSRERKGEDNGRRDRRSSLGIGVEERNAQAPMSAPLPSMGDSESWPTPLLAQGEDRKRALERVEKDKTGKERIAVTTASAPRGKAGWVAVPITPSVIFNTPLPNTNPRRGGRATRGRDATNRGASTAQRGSVTTDKGDGSQPATNGEPVKRARQHISRSSSPPKNKRGTSNEPASKREQRLSTQFSGSRDAVEGSDPSSQKSSSRDWSNGQTPNLQTGASSRYSFSSKPRQVRSGEAFSSEKTEDTEVGAAVSQDTSVPKEEVGLPHRGSRPNLEREEGESGKTTDKRAVSHSESTNFSKFTPGDRRNGPYNNYPNRDRFDRGRGSGRIRSGGHGYHHQTGGHLYGNSTVPSLNSTPHYGIPRSPTMFQQDPYFGQQPQHSRNYRNPSRAQSIPNEPFFGRIANGYGGQPLAPLQTFMGASGQGYDYQNMYPMSAVPYASWTDAYSTSAMIRTQLEYYFSMENLIKDTYLRSHMDSQGFVLLNVVAQFNRLKQLTNDIELIKLACQQSTDIEHRLGSDGKDRLRKRDDWEQWVLAMNERDPSAQNPGPEELSQPPPAQPQVLDTSIAIRHTPLSYPMSPTSGVTPSLQPMDPSVLSNGLSGHEFGEVSGYSCLHSSPTSVSFAGDNSHSPDHILSPTSLEPTLNGSPEAESDTFLDHQIPRLSVIVKRQNPTEHQTLNPIESPGVQLSEAKEKSQAPQVEADQHVPEVESTPNGQLTPQEYVGHTFTSSIHTY